jgi:urea carboxylase
LMERVRAERNPAILDLTPGIRSLQLHYDSRRLPLSTLLDLLSQIEAELPAVDDVEVPTRIVRLPLSWDDPATRLAIERYVQGVRKDAPWAPSNIEFIRRINGLDDIQEVKDIVFNASYLVLGLGDVYLGAPVATPLDPRHRLVTTKYNPARTWTPENAVGIGGAYLCVYGMEGPGGYQFVGRTLQMYNRFKTTAVFQPGSPWLLRFFDQIRFYPVSAEELLDLRERFPHGQVDLDIREERFRLRDYQAFLARESTSIAAFKGKQQAAFDAERQRWLESDTAGAREPLTAIESTPSSLTEGLTVVESPVHGSVWQVRVSPGEAVVPGQTVCVLESMKMEIVVEADVHGTVASVSVAEGATVAPGQGLVVLRPAE